MGKLSDWEKVKTEPLGSGGQSKVFLVRKPERRMAREKSFQVLRELSALGLNREKALKFAAASFDVSRDEQPSELGALKIFQPRAAGAKAEQQALGRIRNEISVLNENRPGFLKLLDHNESENMIVTEYCREGTLADQLLRFKGNAKGALISFLPLLQAAEALHAESIVHRDIKPQNIFIGKNGELLLGDLGIVFLPNQPDRLTITGESVGPRDFMPPWVLIEEQPENIKPNFDVYMLGKVLWCMVAGRLKLHREDFRDSRLDLTRLFPNDPNMYAINAILEKCIVTNERNCFASAGDLLLMVEKFVQMMKWGAQLLRDDVPRPCRVYGDGDYRPRKTADGTVQCNLCDSIEPSC